MKRMIAVFLVVLMIGGLMVSCTQTAPPSDSDESKQSADTGVMSDSSGVGNPSESVHAENTDEKGFLLDRLPAEMDYDGKELSILGWKGKRDVAWPMEANPNNPIQDEAYWHKKGVADRFNVVFNTNYVDAWYEQKDTFFTAARAEDASYDLIHTYSQWPSVLAQEGRLCNLRNLQYPDLEKPWWPESVDEWTVGGGLYFLGSNSSVCQIQELEVIFAHRQMIEAEGLGDPVKAVLRGTWTLEMFALYVKQFAGLAEANPGEIYGLYVTEWSQMDGFYYAAFNSMRHTADGGMEFVYDNKDTMEEITNYINQLYDIFRGVEVQIYFLNGFHALKQELSAMIAAPLREVQNVEDPTIYAAIPYPKVTDEQEGYRSICTNAMDVWMVPNSTTDKVLGGMIIEAVASSEYRNIAPFYFEQYLKRRYSTDADGMKCFDIIRQSMIYDFGRVSQVPFNNKNITTTENSWRYSFWDTYSTSGKKTLNNVFISRYNSSISSMRTILNEVVADFGKYVEQ